MNPSNELSKEKTESKDIFKNLKSDFFLQKLFYNLLKKKSLDIIKYNNKIKERINISIKDYKEYSEIYSSIEIEIKPVNNKYGEFINMKENEKYFHIYFNDNKEEIKRNYLNKNDDASELKIIIDYQVKSFKYLFNGCKCIEYIYFKKFYRNNINNMEGMFHGCSSLKELILSNFNTNNVTNMGYMFSGCSSLKELNLSNFNTNNVTNMSDMFRECSSLKELNLSNFYTNNVTDMGNMFRECSSLKELNLYNFNTDNVTYMRHMFSGCSSLKELNISNFKTNILTHIGYMFAGCSSLKELNLSGFISNDEIFMRYMFSGCSNQLKNTIRSEYRNIKEEAFLDDKD